MRVALAQTDCVLGDVDANLTTAREQIEQAVAQGSDLVVFPELSLHGYHLGALRRDTSVEARDPRLLELAREPAEAEGMAVLERAAASWSATAASAWSAGF